MEKSSFSTIELDAAQEIISIGVGEAAYSFSELVNQKIKIQIKELLFMDDAQVISEMTSVIEEEGVVVSQDFTKGVSGRAVLFFSRANAELLMQVLFGVTKDIEHFDTVEFTSFEEIGNIVLGSCVSKMGDITNTFIHFLMPYAKILTLNTLKETIESKYKFAVSVRSVFIVGKSEIKSEILLLFKTDEFHTIIKETTKYNQAHVK